MSLIDYLNKYFYTLDQLLDISKVSLADFRSWQKRKMMPSCSYNLAIDLSSRSYFGEHQEFLNIEYYAKGYTEWLALLHEQHSEKGAFDLFKQKYGEQLVKLKSQGFESQLAKFNDELPLLVESEWQHFIVGTYGLCSQSGLPDDIASKELAIAIIEPLISHDAISSADKQHLSNVVNLLDKASAQFAPHEVTRSSRHRFVNQVRQKYAL